MADKVVINTSGVRAVLKSNGVNAMLKEEADKIADRAEGLAQFNAPLEEPAYGAWVTEGKYTSLGHVSTRNIGRGGKAAYNECAKHNTLKKAMGV